MTTSRMSNLERDLVEEIVSRVPLKHMRAVRLTCKKWSALFKSRSFTKMNIANEEAAARELEESRMMVMMDYSIHLMSIVVNENPSIKSLGKLTFLDDSERVKISKVYHCEGLLLCTLRNEHCTWRDDNTKIVVWNPYLGQTRWIKTSNNYLSRKLYGRYSYALGYGVDKTENPKILRFIDDFLLCPKNPALLYEIYDFESDSWTILDVCPQWRIMSPRGVSLKGNTYWGAVKRKAYSPIDHIICFDFTSQRFGPLLPLPFRAYGRQFASLSCVGQEKLAALFQRSETCNREIWITSKIEATEVSWTNFLTLDLGSFLDTKLMDKSFLVDEEKKLVIVFDKQGQTVCNLTQDRVDFIGEDGSFSKLVLGEPADKECWPIVCSFVPSLVQIERGERVTQSDQDTMC